MLQNLENFVERNFPEEPCAQSTLAESIECGNLLELTNSILLPLKTLRLPGRLQVGQINNLAMLQDMDPYSAVS